MSNLVPARLTKDELLSVIDDIRARVAADDSFEGNLEYGFCEDDPRLFEARGVYRVGNSEGQGGVRMVGSVPPPEVGEPGGGVPTSAG